MRCLVGLACATFLSFGIQHSLATTSSLVRPAVVQANVAAYNQETCVRRLVRERVPRGTDVYISASGYTFQLLSQYLAAWANPTESGRTASLEVAVVSVPDGPCDGLDLKVTRP